MHTNTFLCEESHAAWTSSEMCFVPLGACVKNACLLAAPAENCLCRLAVAVLELDVLGGDRVELGVLRLKPQLDFWPAVKASWTLPIVRAFSRNPSLRSCSVLLRASSVLRFEDDSIASCNAVSDSGLLALVED